jgi:predicted transcriptional regulator of viral defense system
MATTSNSQAERVLHLVETRGLVRARELDAMGISPTHLQRLYEQGLLARSGRGIYTLPDVALNEHQALSEAALRIPRGVVCLLSALRFHHIGTQNPHQLWLALPPRTHRPKFDWPPLKLVQMTSSLLIEDAGVEEHLLNGIRVRMTNPARTVVDCFRFRNKIGLDVALEAAKDGWRNRRYTMGELSRYQKLCRVTEVMRPYLEAIIA